MALKRSMIYLQGQRIEYIFVLCQLIAKSWSVTVAQLAELLLIKQKIADTRMKQLNK